MNNPIIKPWFIIVILAMQISHACSQNRNFYLDTWQVKSFVTPLKSVPVSLGTGESGSEITLFVNDSIAPVLPVQLGLNTTFRSGPDMVKKRLANYTNSGMGSFRFPGGSGSNIYFWDGNIPGKFLINFTPIDGTAASALKIDEFVAFIDSLDAEATIVVNYFYARYGVTREGTRESRVNQAAEYAAGFVNYVNNVLRAGVRNWEVGNECYGKWEEGFDVNGSIVTGKEYGEDFRVFAAKMKAADPTIKIGAVMFPKDDNWNNQVMAEVKNHADFLVVHNYFTTENEATVQNILASTPQIAEIKKQMEDCIIANTAFPKDYFPVAFTEYNCRGPHTTTFVNACFTAEVLGRIIENKYGLATRWVGEFPWKVGTHAIFAVDDPDQIDYSVRQAYPVYHYFNKAFGDHLIKSVSGNEKIKVFASRFSDGKTGLVVINSGSTEQSFNLNFANSSDSGKCWYYEVYANSINEGDKKFYVNGFTSQTKGGGPDQLSEIPPFESGFNESTIFRVKKYSVTFYVFEGVKISGSIDLENMDKKTRIFPNPVRSKLNFNSPYIFDSLCVSGLNGQNIYSGPFVNPFDMSFIPAGSYLLTLGGKSKRFSQLVLKQ